MYELKYSSTYKSSLKKLKKSGKWNSIEKTLQTILVMLQEKGRVKFSDPNLNKRHNDHELYEDKLYERGTHEVHVKPSVLLVYITKGNTVTLLNISSHSGYEGRCRELVYISKRERHHLRILIMPDVLRESC